MLLISSVLFHNHPLYLLPNIIILSVLLDFLTTTLTTVFMVEFLVTVFQDMKVVSEIFVALDKMCKY